MVVRNVEADSTVVGVPGRVVHQSGVRINPLAHSALPDTEASVIRNLMERIDNLEHQISILQNHKINNYETENTNSQDDQTPKVQSLKDREIIEFLGDNI